MIKKIGLFIVSFILILRIGKAYADIIRGPDYRGEQSKTRTCIMLEGANMKTNRIIIMDYTSGKIHELSGKICINDAIWDVFLLDNAVDINTVSRENIEKKAILISNNAKKNRTHAPIDLKQQTLKDAFPQYVEGLYKVDYNPVDESKSKISLLSIKTTRIAGLPDFPGLSKDDFFYRGGYSQQYGRFLSAWMLTLIIETIIIFLIAKFYRKEQSLKNRNLFFTGILASTITLPLLRFVFPMIFVNYLMYTIIGELLVTIIEVIIIKYGLKISRGKAIIASVICNAASYGIGLLIF